MAAMSGLDTLRTVMKRGRMGFFCDFDGTISTADMIGAIMMHFVPEEAAPIIRSVRQGERSVRDGVAALFRLLPAVRFEEIRQYAVAATTLRPGFIEFVQLCAEQGWPFTVVSGGFDFFVDPALAPVREQVRVYCNQVRVQDGHLEVDWPHPCADTCDGTCGLCKPGIMQADKVRDSLDAAIVIGDGVTDFKVAAEADFVFARAALLDLAAQQGLPHVGFDTFYDIARLLRQAMALEQDGEGGVHVHT